MTRSVLAMPVIAAATWDAWRWYLGRIAAAPEEGAAMWLTLALILVLGWRERGVGSTDRRTGAALWTASLLLALYAASFDTLPPIGRAALAILAMLLCLFTGLTGRRPPPAFWGLVALSLPVLPSLQFTLGFGMRMVSAMVTVFLLRAQGLDVARDGTFLVWRGEIMQFDAPCSGVNMLWTGLLVALMGALARNFGYWRTACAVLAGIVLTLAGNVLRAASLFFVETGSVGRLPAWGHEAVGIAAFLMAAAGLMWVLRKLEPVPGMGPR
jgi:exosortase/archaeosortase family protein